MQGSTRNCESCVTSTLLMYRLAQATLEYMAGSLSSILPTASNLMNRIKGWTCCRTWHRQTLSSDKYRRWFQVMFTGILSDPDKILKNSNCGIGLKNLKICLPRLSSRHLHRPLHSAKLDQHRLLKLLQMTCGVRQEVSHFFFLGLLHLYAQILQQ